MRVIRKDAMTTAPTDDDFPGTFEAILSAPTKDRDGDTLLPEEWKQPLPDHITVDDASSGDDSANTDVAASKAYRGSLKKSIAGSLEAVQDRVRDALQDANPNAYIYLRGTVPDGNGGGYVVFAVEPNDGPWTDD